MKQEEKITAGQAKHIIQDYKGGTFFTVTFVKRSTGETRVMNCRKGVHKGLSGGGLRFDPKDKGLVGVFDIPKGQHRFIATEDIRRIALGGKVYVVE